ncbi:MAG: DUF4389 domain-containing protein [Gammaproteobacteria bacterium]
MTTKQSSKAPTKEQIKQNVKSPIIWIRLLYMALFVAFYLVAEILLSAMVIFQFLHRLLLGSTNDYVLKFTDGLAQYFFQVIRYLAFNTEEKPFPFTDWPKSGAKK